VEQIAELPMNVHGLVKYWLAATRVSPSVPPDMRILPFGIVARPFGGIA
jgi:hypothetical protein